MWRSSINTWARYGAVTTAELVMAPYHYLVVVALALHRCRATEHYFAGGVDRLDCCCNQ